VLTVEREDAGKRLDRFIARAAEGASRAEVQRWIEGGHVRVDGRVRKASEKLRAGACVEVDPQPPARSDAVAEDGIAFDVLHVDDALVVLNKPAGLVVHPARGHESGTLVNGLLGRGLFDRQMADPEDKEGHARPGIVHRLDKGTSGVMVVARTPVAREGLKHQFAAHTIERAYEAICVGQATDATIETLHGRHPHDRMRFTSRVKQGKRAVTRIRVLERLLGATHVECSLETGRTHQIRVHLSESGHPVLGDPLYAKPPKNPLLREVAESLGHQALHARLLGFTHPTTGIHLRFEAPLPRDFLEALRRLRK
jgi:23S rRNA pseudouridine1911/1915/1917 synthase